MTRSMFDLPPLNDNEFQVIPLRITHNIDGGILHSLGWRHGDAVINTTPNGNDYPYIRKMDEDGRITTMELLVDQAKTYKLGEKEK